MTVRPYGTWPSALDAHAVARAGNPQFAHVNVRGDRIRWSEARPEEGGRIAVVDSTGNELTPAGSNARTRVHEYGGGAVWYHGDDVFHSEFTDSRLYRNGTPITPGAAGPELAPLRRRRREPGRRDDRVRPRATRGRGGAERARLVPGRRLGGADDHPVRPRLLHGSAVRSRQATRLAWLAWDHPNMPWDGTYLYVDGDVVAGAADESVIDPRWSPDGVLHWCSDRDGWWNLYRDGEQLTRFDDREIGGPAWVFGITRYVFLDDGRIVCVVTNRAVDSLHLLGEGDLGLAGRVLRHCACADGSRIVFVRRVADEASTLVSSTSRAAASEIVALVSSSSSIPAVDLRPARDRVPDPRRRYRARLLLPAREHRLGRPADETPPLRVTCHGGPTAHTLPYSELDTLYFTQRGIGVVDVNYRGSTGYGREYRRMLNGRWGEIDWADCVDAAKHLARDGDDDADAHVGRGRQRRRLRRLLRARVRSAGVRRRRQLLRRRRRGGARARHAQVRVPLPRLDDRAVSRARRSVPRALAGALRRPDRASDAAACRGSTTRSCFRPRPR